MIQALANTTGWTCPSLTRWTTAQKFSRIANSTTAADQQPSKTTPSCVTPAAPTWESRLGLHRPLPAPIALGHQTGALSPLGARVDSFRFWRRAIKSRSAGGADGCRRAAPESGIQVS